jgi:hypothetical protein
MAEYIGIKGSNVQSLASDPSNPIEGQVWYNTTGAVLKGYANIPAGAWSSGGALNQARYNLSAAGASNTAALCIAGYLTPPTTYFDLTESYDGSTWTEVADVNSSSGGLFAFGSQTAAMKASGGAGSYVTNSESWNGTSWAEGNNVNTAREAGGSTGTGNTAGMIFGGYSTILDTVTETWDGTSWAEVNNLNAAKQQIGSATQGSSTASLCIGGEIAGSPSTTGNVESWDGTSWTEVNNLTTARKNMASSGIQTDALGFGGYNPSPGEMAQTEAYNGTSWTEVADLATARTATKGAGTGASSLMIGGNTGGSSQSALTEEWNFPAGNEIQTFTDS